MRSPDRLKFFADAAREIDHALIELKRSTKASERVALVRVLRSLFFLLGFTPIEKRQTVIPPLCWTTAAQDELSATADRKV